MGDLGGDGKLGVASVGVTSIQCSSGSHKIAEQKQEEAECHKVEDRDCCNFRGDDTGDGAGRGAQSEKPQI